MLLLLALALTSGCAWLDRKQREIIYRPTPGVPANFAGLRPGDQRYFVALPSVAGEADQALEMWWLPHPDRDAPTLLYFHGTFRNLYENARKIDALREAGFSVLAVDYRGWGRSSAITPSEQTILQDANLAWSELQRRQPLAARRVIYGHSMGSGVAVDLASRLHAPGDYAALILESAFTSFTDVAHEAGLLAGWMAALSSERFASVEKIARVDAPLLMIHGSADTTIPVLLGEKLFDAARPPKRWIKIAGGAHSDLDLVAHDAYQAALRDWIREYLSRRPSPSAETPAPSAAARPDPARRV